MKRIERLAALNSLVTGACTGSFANVQELAEELLGHPVFTHEMPAFADRLRALALPEWITTWKQLMAEENG